ncbi:MAG: pilus assembly protein TadG-related protein [Candidatus Dormiibacterota bacterium]
MTSRQSPRKSWHHTQKGQVLLIFALTAIVLFAIMGLAIDAGISYLHSDQQEKAASAAALSGVSYLPGDMTDATREALLTAQRDGYTNTSGTPTSAITVSVSEPANTTNELTVSITAPAPVYFLDLFGFGQHEVTSSATAEYLPPIQLGQPGNSLGSTEQEIADQTGEYFLRTEGYGNPRSEGDAFTPTPYDDNTTGCNGNCSDVSSPDVHQISCIEGDDLCSGATDTKCGVANGTTGNMCVNDTGGYDYLIYVPPGDTDDVQIYNPSFDPGTDNDADVNSYHDDDSSFPDTTTGTQPPAYDYAAMGFTLFAVPDINNRGDDVPLKQDIFCPFDAYGIEDGGAVSYTYYANCNNPNSSIPGSPTTVSGTTPTVFQNYVSLLSYTGGNSTKLFNASFTSPSLASYESGSGSSTALTGAATTGSYYRLRVDTLMWNGAVINSSQTVIYSPSPVNSASLPDSYPLAHNAYALRVVTPGSSSLTNNSCNDSSTSCTVSAMADLCIYTPIQAGAGGGSFQVPLFSLPVEYAGKTIAVRVFDPGDVSGTAYLGILQPSYTGINPSTGLSETYPEDYATLALDTTNEPAVDNLGVSLAAYEAGGASTRITTDGPSPATYTFSTTSAVVETSVGGGSLFNGQWVQFDIQVPSNYDPSSTLASYWDLYYNVAAGTTAGDTISVEVQYLGSPVHLLP